MAYKLLPEESKKPEETSIFSLGTLKRIPGQIAAGAAAPIAGQFGDIPAGISGLFGYPYEGSALEKALPTTESHLQKIQKTFPSTKPTNWLEKQIQDLTKDAVSLFLPGRYLKMGKYALTPLRSLGISLAANTLGTTISEFTGDQKKGEMVKGGTMLALSLFNPQTATKVAGDLYNKANIALPIGAKQNASKFLSGLNKIENDILQKRPRDIISKSEKFVLDKIKSFKKLIKNNEVDMRQVVAQKRSFNSDLKNELFEIKDWSERAGAKKLAQRVYPELRQLIKDYGTKHPEWWKLQSGADIAHGSIEDSKYIKKFVDKHIRGLSPELGHILGAGIPAGLEAGIGAVLGPVGAIGAAAAYQTAKIAKRVIESPVLRKHYAKVIGAASAQNVSAFKKEAKKTEDLLKKDQTIKGKYKLLD